MINIQVPSVSLSADLPGINAGLLTLDGQGCVIAANGTSGLQVRSANDVLRNLTLAQLLRPAAGRREQRRAVQRHGARHLAGRRTDHAGRHRLLRCSTARSPTTPRKASC
ncbi:MAG: hypothetical protein U1E76_04260 [Planctomycetota bacterium]